MRVEAADDPVGELAAADDERPVRHPAGAPRPADRLVRHRAGQQVRGHPGRRDDEEVVHRVGAAQPAHHHADQADRQQAALHQGRQVVEDRQVQPGPVRARRLEAGDRGQPQPGVGPPPDRLHRQVPGQHEQVGAEQERHRRAGLPGRPPRSQPLRTACRCPDAHRWGVPRRELDAHHHIPHHVAGAGPRSAGANSPVPPAIVHRCPITTVEGARLPNEHDPSDSSWVFVPLSLRCRPFGRGADRPLARAPAVNRRRRTVTADDGGR